MGKFAEISCTRIFLFIFAFCYLPAFGQVLVTDGDTIRYQGEKIRLDGIDAPEINQQCKTKNKFWNCGDQAANALKNLIKNKSNKKLNCEGISIDKYGRQLSTCFFDDLNINKWMIENGWALAYRHYSKRYIESENKARQLKKGIWQGEFIYPWNWRKGKRLIAHQNSQKCQIKGNISSKGEKIYHTPEGMDYLNTKISEKKGERWFCSEPEALAKGWRKSRR